MNLMTLPAKFALMLCFSFAFYGCKTEDVYPTVILESSANVLSIDGGSVVVKAKLNGPVSKQLTIPISFSGTAILNVDFNSSGMEIIIPANASDGSISLTGKSTTDTARKFIEVSLSPTERVVIFSPSSIRIELVNCTSDRDNDGISDCDDDCPDDVGPVENNGCPWLGLVINEVLYDPASGIAGDANGDGTRDPLQDEFVELFNSNLELNISGYTLSDAAAVRHVFPAGTIVLSKKSIVVFGGGTPTGTFGGAIVQTASSGQLNLTNSGDVLTLRDTSSNVLAVFDINGLGLVNEPDEAYSRNPDITGSFVRHSTISTANGALFSPGRKVNGSNF